MLNASYQEVFGFFGATRNLGVSVNLFYSENVFGNFRATRDFEHTLATPAYLWDYRTEDNLNNRKQASISAKFDYRVSPHTRVTLNLIYNAAFEPARRRYATRAFTNQTAPTAATSGVVPGYTDRLRQVRPVTASTIDVIVNLGFACDARPNLSLTCDVANLFNAPQKFYRGIPDQFDIEIIQGTTLTVGIQGRF